MEKLFLIVLLIKFSFEQEDQTQNFSDGGTKIVGGEQIPLSDAPYQGSLQRNGLHRCGGSIISTSFVISAAHCTYFMRSRELTVRVGTDQLGLGGDVIQVRTFRNHPLFNPFTINYDIAILQLATEITLETGVKEVIRLPQLNDIIEDKTKAFVSGWGDTNNPKESNEFLRAVHVPIINQKVCKQAYPYLSANMVCAGDMNGGIDSCQGDSGGPLKRVSDGILIGIVSFGNGCASPGYPGVYSRVASSRSWIKSVVKF